LTTNLIEEPVSVEIPENELKDFLELKYRIYNQPSFIESDPISIPRRFDNREDIEIAGFLTATIAWGQRKTIISNAAKLMNLMGNSPYSFLMDASDKQLQAASKFVHRTFNSADTAYFFKALRSIYLLNGGLKTVFEGLFLAKGNMYGTLAGFRNLFISFGPETRTGKHVSDVTKGSAAKRLNMYLRWMVRNDRRGVDFGLWTQIPASALYLPLDLHTGNVSRKLGLLSRKQSDWKAVEEITSKLREFDPTDPVKYDFALFGLGIFEKF